MDRDTQGPGDLAELRRTLEIVASNRRFNKMAFFDPYPKQEAFFDLGATKRERLLIAGNQVGKTEAGAFETVCHLTGDYPEWWMGRRFDHPTVGWICGETGLVVRDVQQEKLLGEPGVEDAFGTGYIPFDRIVGRPTLSRGVANAYDTVQVVHKTNGVKDGTSVGVFKSYEQGRTKFQGKGIDWGWLDEEALMEIYSEVLTRTSATGGSIFTTFTPLKGKTQLVTRFIEEPSQDRGVITMTMDDALHYRNNPEKKRKALEGYPEHERDARAMGIPMMGEGRIFAFPDSMIMEPAIQNIPATWRAIWGIDFGIAKDHPFAAALLLIDPDLDAVHVHYVVKIIGGLPVMHAAAMKLLGADAPVAWPHDGDNREAGSGETLKALYKAQGLKMLPEHAQFIDGGNKTEPGLLEMNQMAQTGRWKVANHLSDVFDETRFYHRKNGSVVREKDDVLSAIRYGMMMRRYARSVPLGRGRGTGRRGEPLMATGIDFDLG